MFTMNVAGVHGEMLQEKYHQQRYDYCTLCRKKTPNPKGDDILN